MKTLNEHDKIEALISLERRMDDFIEKMPENHNFGFIPDNLSMLMAKAALTILETVVDCNVYFEENPIPTP